MGNAGRGTMGEALAVMGVDVSADGAVAGDVDVDSTSPGSLAMSSYRCTEP